MQLCLVPQENVDRCHRFQPTYSIDVIAEGKRKGRGEKPPRKEMMGYRVFCYINRIGRPKAVTFIPIFLGHYRQLSKFNYYHTWKQMYCCASEFVQLGDQGQGIWIYTTYIHFNQGSKGMRQWPINLCISKMMIHKIPLL